MFVDIKRGHFGGDNMPSNIIRVNRGSISLSENISEKFQLQREVLDAGSEKVKLGLAVDKEAEQIKLIPQAINGFSFVTYPAKGSKSLRLNQPSNFKRADMPIGDYLLEDEGNLVFTLQK